jgi:hypothetical protein
MTKERTMKDSVWILSRYLEIPFGRAMAQAVSRRPVATDVQVRARISPRGIYGRQSDTVTFFYEFFGFFLSISFHRGPPYSYIIWGVNNRLAGGRNSET